ncbi:alpha/beta hydrolase [Hymenobacter jejuensis]|uniref:Alpha/beta hydrolase n=1 Tax=Hymenobacter jejuensis TaxID=2502781 RepID=A0A5B8A4P7_9BACT|nr:alpha/beta hydrolase [Hymenobacter jejuensis]QDA62338.1 alpha/beta hydrolase [Hymenobacter jejuensis]
MENVSAKTIVFITGSFVHNSCWDEWKTFFEDQGYACLAPPWPHKDASPAELRSQHPYSPIAQVRLADLLDYHTELIRRLPEKPILIGHSFGGLMTQLLVQRGLAAAGVAIHSVPPQGVITLKWSFIRSVTPALGLFTSTTKTYLMPFRHWQYTFTNGMPLAVQQETYEQLVVPESKLASRDGLTKVAKVDFAKPHVPLLFVAGSTDNIIPASLNYANYRRYKKHGDSVTDYKEFAGRNHFVLGQPTWQEDAAYISQWLTRQHIAVELAK